MRALLLALCLLLCGCGALADLQGTATLSNGTLTGSVTTPYGNITFSPTGIRGELRFLVTIVDFSDQQCPLSEADAEDVVKRIDAFVARNTTGLAVVKGRVARVTLGETALYTAETFPEAATSTRLQRDARLASPGPEPFKLFLTPATPIIATGGGFVDGSGGEAFVSVWTAWQNLPIPHELGHMLGLPHGDRGVMRGDDAAIQADWNAILPLP